MKIDLLTDRQLAKLHQSSLHILETIGVQLPHAEVLRLFAEAGATVDRENHRVRIPERLVAHCLETAGKSFTIYGRDRAKKAEFGLGQRNYNSSAGQALWVNDDLTRRYATLDDVRTASRLADALPAMNVVGAMADPHELPVEYRCVVVAAEQLKHTTKPITFWFHDRASARFLMELLTIVAGSEEEVARYPLAYPFLEPISPLRFPERGVDLLFETCRLNLPVPIGPMAQMGASARRHTGRHDGPAERGNPGRAVHRAVDPPRHTAVLWRHPARLRHAHHAGDLRRPGAGLDGRRP